MAMDAKSINEKVFKIVTFRGYQVLEVDNFLDEVALEVEKMQQQIKDLQSQLAVCLEKEKKTGELEQTLRDTLITAQRAAEDVVRASREKAAAMIKDSELEGRRIVEDAEQRSQAAAQRLDALKRDSASVKALIRKVMNEQLRLLEESYPEEEPKPAPAEPARPVFTAMPTLADLDQTQEFSTREVREQVVAEEQTVFPRFRNFNERLPQSGQNGDAQA
jgi:cell division initiation protein